MIRKQIYITPEEERELTKRARKRRITQAYLIREALDIYISQYPPQDPHPLDAIIGIGRSGLTDGAINHDHYLYGAPKKRR